MHSEYDCGDAFGDDFTDGLSEEIAEMFAPLGAAPDFEVIACRAPRGLDRQQRTEQREQRDLRAEWARTVARHTEAKARACRACGGPITELPKRGPVPAYCSDACRDRVYAETRNAAKRAKRAAARTTAPPALPIAA